ncbi:MAG TPA: Mur ligase family protein [Gemmatimonadales bacterium]|nr:Mur ligase family protein [Gemmatimonadales bacterium]
MPVLDSRRLTGPSLLLDRPGAVLEARVEPSQVKAAVIAWEQAARQLLQAVGWPDQQLASRSFSGGVSLALTAPIDGLYAATELNERAWAVAAAELAGDKQPDIRKATAALLDDITSQKNPRLAGLYHRALSRGLTFLHGEDLVSAGSGQGALIWHIEDLPDPDTVKWETASDIPIALVTGSNGKTTVVRMLGAMLEASGRVAGLTSTDGVTVGNMLLEEGDFAGPSGARMVLRLPETETAVLETARGGILRRGLPVDHAEVAVVTNIADDHLGEFGIETLPDLADTKLTVAKALSSGGTLVVNADDPLMVGRSRNFKVQLSWFSLNPASPVVRKQIQEGGTVVLSDHAMLVIARGEQRTPLLPVAEIPVTFGGTAEHNVANAVAAVAAGLALGLDPAIMAFTLRRFGSDLEDNPGRANLVELGGIRILLDFAHNPHGMSALVEIARTIPAQRRLLLVGQAGDRGDEAIRALARAAWALQPDRVVVKDMETYLRGRSPGEVPGLLADEFLQLGLPSGALSRVGPELEAVRAALEWARPDDLLVLAVHENRRAVLDLFDQLASTGWHAGDPLPGAPALRG